MNWKTVLVVTLVVLLALIGIPLLMPGMGGGAMCHECGPAVSAAHACSLLAVLVALTLGAVLLAVQVRARRDPLGDLLRSLDFDRPPQLLV